VEWSAQRMVVTHLQNLEGNSLRQFEDPDSEVMLLPEKSRSGKLIYPPESKRS
jgi:hypothetical protein